LKLLRVPAALGGFLAVAPGGFAAARVTQFTRVARDWEQRLFSGVSNMPLNQGREFVNGLIYLIGLIVVILFILSFLGLR
jgi:hypothetical protein